MLPLIIPGLLILGPLFLSDCVEREPEPEPEPNLVNCNKYRLHQDMEDPVLFNDDAEVICGVEGPLMDSALEEKYFSCARNLASQYYFQPAMSIFRSLLTNSKNTAMAQKAREQYDGLKNEAIEECHRIGLFILAYDRQFNHFGNSQRPEGIITGLDALLGN